MKPIQDDWGFIHMKMPKPFRISFTQKVLRQVGRWDNENERNEHRVAVKMGRGKIMWLGSKNLQGTVYGVLVYNRPRTKKKKS